MPHTWHALHMCAIQQHCTEQTSTAPPGPKSPQEGCRAAATGQQSDPRPCTGPPSPNRTQATQEQALPPLPCATSASLLKASTRLSLCPALPWPLGAAFLETGSLPSMTKSW